MLIDIHLHMDIYERYENALDQALRLLTEHKILVLSNSMDIRSYETTLKIAKRSKFVLPCFGVHPFMAPDYVDKLDSLTDYLDQAIVFGEIGLDHLSVEDRSQYPAQEKILKRFLEIAEKQNKVVILHLVGAEDKGLEMIRSYCLKKVIVHGVVHGYGGSWKTLKKMSDLSIHFSRETLKKMFDLGIYFSVGGNAIMDEFKTVIPTDYWNRVRQIVKKIPTDLLLIETSGPCQIAPDSPPDKSMPTYINGVMRKVAEIRETPVEELTHLVTDNFMNLIKCDKRLETRVRIISRNQKKAED